MRHIAESTRSTASSNWLSPLQPPIKFTTLEVKGELGDGGFSMKKLEGLAYDGQFSGQGEISWRDGVKALWYLLKFRF